MKRHLTELPCPRTLYWDLFFEYAGEVILCDLATLRGTFRPEQRVIVPRIELPDGGETFMPNYIIRSVSDARDVVYRFPQKMPLCLEFSGVCPAHHVVGHPVFPIPKRQLPFGLEDKPRARDREGVRMGACSWLGELIIDVDLDETSYDRRGVCECVGHKTCCDTCWALFLRPAMQVLRYLLEEVFSITAYFFVYSGRRGFHCWVLDKQVVCWTIEQRKSFIEKLSQLGQDETCIADDVYAMLEPIFDEALSKRYTPPPTRAQERDCKRAAVFKALYPKFDAVVTYDTTHNHKLPLMMHPATGRICVTIDRVEEFLPSKECYKQGDLSKQTFEQWLVPIVRALDIAYGKVVESDKEEEEESEETKRERLVRELWYPPEL